MLSYVSTVFFLGGNHTLVTSYPLFFVTFSLQVVEKVDQASEIVGYWRHAFCADRERKMRQPLVARIHDSRLLFRPDKTVITLQEDKIGEESSILYYTFEEHILLLLLLLKGRKEGGLPYLDYKGG